MLERGVHMGVQTKRDDDRIVVAVYVCLNTEETLDELAHGCLKVLWEVDPNPGGKDLLVVDIRLYPAHEVLDVFGSRHLRGTLVLPLVLPEVLEFVCSLHLGASSW